MYPTLKATDLDTLPREIYAHGSAIHSTLVQIAGSLGSALFVGIMSADADRLMASGLSKADAYASGFSHTLSIDLVIIVIALIASIFFARVIAKNKKAAQQTNAEQPSETNE